MASQFSSKRRVDALFRALASDYLFREQFVTDPAQILTEYVHGERLEPDQAAAANQLVFAMVSNPGLLDGCPPTEAIAKTTTTLHATCTSARPSRRRADQPGVDCAPPANPRPLRVQTTVLRGLIGALTKAVAAAQCSPGRR